VVWGLAYKGEVKDTRRSPSLEILKLLKQSRAKIRVFDPYVPRVVVGGRAYESGSSEIESVRDADALIMATAHNAFRSVDLSKRKRRSLKDYLYVRSADAGIQLWMRYLSYFLTIYGSRGTNYHG